MKTLAQRNFMLPYLSALIFFSSAEVEAVPRAGLLPGQCVLCAAAGPQLLLATRQIQRLVEVCALGGKLLLQQQQQDHSVGNRRT